MNRDSSGMPWSRTVASDSTRPLYPLPFAFISVHPWLYTDPMDSRAAKKRIEELRELLERANRAYYAEAQPLMSDRDFDELLRELIGLEETFPQFDDPNSPSRRVGGAP